MIVKLLTEHHLVFLSLKGGCIGSSKSTHVKMSHCWKSHALAHMSLSLPTREHNILRQRCIAASVHGQVTYQGMLTTSSVILDGANTMKSGEKLLDDFLKNVFRKVF